MGPESAKSFPGARLVRADPTGAPAGPRHAGDRLRAARQATSSAPSSRRPGRPSPRRTRGRTTANWVDFLEQVEAWLDPAATRVYAILDNLKTHRATDVLLFALAHPRWEFVFQPKYAAYLNLIEPWWKILRSLALKGRRFETWEEIVQAVDAATATGTPTPSLRLGPPRAVAPPAAGIALPIAA